jgi:aspartate racemase
MGVYATLDFLEQVFNFTPDRKNWGDLRIIIDNVISIPNVIRAALFKGPDPTKEIVASIHNCEKIGAEFIAVPCNSVHYYYRAVEPHINIPWINIVETTSRVALSAGRSPLILGGLITTEKRIYSEFLPDAVYPTVMEHDLVINVIEEIALNGRLSEDRAEAMRKLVLRYKGAVDAVILACTELSIAFKNRYMVGIPVIDSNVEYAMEVVKWSMRKGPIQKTGGKKRGKGKTGGRRPPAGSSSTPPGPPSTGREASS